MTARISSLNTITRPSPFFESYNRITPSRRSTFPHVNVYDLPLTPSGKVSESSDVFEVRWEVRYDPLNLIGGEEALPYGTLGKASYHRNRGETPRFSRTREVRGVMNYQLNS
jgi:hypothetical protein